MRILYGVFGYGRGHATRALSVLPELCSRHDVLVLAGGDAYDALAPSYPVLRIPTLHLEYGEDGKRSIVRTLRTNLGHIADILADRPRFRTLARKVSDFQPDIAICDAEPWSHTIAARLRIPRISFDHFGVLAYCRPPLPWYDRIRSVRDVWVYRTLMGRPDRVIVSSFYDGGVRDPRIRLVGPILRAEVTARRATPGPHLLVYLNRGAWQLVPPIEEALRQLGMPVVIYGTDRRGDDGQLSFRAPSNDLFLDDLASCRAVFSTAGNQLVGEAVWFGKPMLVTPELTVEQRLNAAAVERLGIGRSVDHGKIDAPLIRDFLGCETSYRGQMRHLVRDGRAQAVAAIERFARELLLARRWPTSRALEPA